MSTLTLSSRMSGIDSQFLAPPMAEEEKPLSRASDCGEVAMHRLRHPFAVGADTAPRRSTATHTR